MSNWLRLSAFAQISDHDRLYKKKRKTKGNGDQERQKKLWTMDMKVHNVLSENTGRRKKCCRKKMLQSLAIHEPRPASQLAKPNVPHMG